MQMVRKKTVHNFAYKNVFVSSFSMTPFVACVLQIALIILLAVLAITFMVLYFKEKNKNNATTLPLPLPTTIL